jgi:hypothetical protein
MACRTWQQNANEALLLAYDDAHLKAEMVQFLLGENFWDKQTLKWNCPIARFNACLNPNQDGYFKLSEAWALAKRPVGRPPRPAAGLISALAGV